MFIVLFVFFNIYCLFIGLWLMTEGGIVLKRFKIDLIVIKFARVGS